MAFAMTPCCLVSGSRKLAPIFYGRTLLSSQGVRISLVSHQRPGLSLRARGHFSVAATSDAAGASEPQKRSPTRHKHKKRASSSGWLIGGLAAGALLAATHLVITTGAASAVRAYLSTSILARSGFFAAFSLIFLSELGDKTFFIAALLAMKCGRTISFIGSTGALAVMTLISVAIGYAFKHVPEVLTTSAPVGEYLGAALLVYFGVRTLKEAWETREASSDSEAESELKEAEEEGYVSFTRTLLQHAPAGCPANPSTPSAFISLSINLPESLETAEKGGKLGGKSRGQALLEVASLIFVAEWGDRSMLATIALGASQSPFGVTGGAVLAHAVATLLAVLGGAMLSKHISEKTVGYLGGSLFLVFAAATVFGFF